MNLDCKALVLNIYVKDLSSALWFQLSPLQACAVQVWGSAGWGVCGHCCFFFLSFFPLCDFTRSVSLKILRLLFLGPWSGKLPGLHTAEKWAQPEASFSCFFPSLHPSISPETLETLKKIKKIKKSCLFGNCWGCGDCVCVATLQRDVPDCRINIRPAQKAKTQKPWDRRTGSEEEHGHGAVVPSLRAPAQRDQGHQKGHQGGHSSGHQQDQGGDLPVCRRRRYRQSYSF